MGWIEWARAAFALLAVLALIGLAAVAARRLGMLSGAAPGQKRRMKVVESMMLDPRRRLVIIQCDDREHLVLLSPSGDRKIESNAARPPAIEAQP
ncbi:MAG: flagellar biosynthetic protein FliO [Hyphomonadaceae bacterium]